MNIPSQAELSVYLREKFNDPAFTVNQRADNPKIIDITLNEKTIFFNETYQIFPEVIENGNERLVSAQYLDGGLPNHISKICDGLTLALLNDKIFKLQEQHQQIDHAIVASLQNLLASLCQHKHRPENRIITEHFINLVDDLLVKPQMSMRAITRSFEDLDKKLYGKKPSAKVTAAICGVIGALVGGAIGIVFGAFITIPKGCYGALPGAIWGAIKGYTIATSIGIQFGILSGIFGGIYGTFKGNNQVLKFSIFKNSLQMNKIGGDVVANISEVKNQLQTKFK